MGLRTMKTLETCITTVGGAPGGGICDLSPVQLGHLAECIKVEMRSHKQRSRGVAAELAGWLGYVEALAKEGQLWSTV